MVHSLRNDKESRLIIEEMRLSEPRILITYALFAVGLYIFLSSFEGNHYRIIKSWDFIIILILVFYVPLVIRGFLNKIHEIFEIGDNTQGLSPLRNLFVSEEAFYKYKNKIVCVIYKHQYKFSIWVFIFYIIIVVGFDIINHSFGKPFGEETVTPLGILITLLCRYLSWWVIIFAFLSLLWAILCFVLSFIWLKDDEGLRLNESIKCIKTLINIKKFDENALNRSLEGYYTYNRFVVDSRQITDISFFIALRIAIFAFLISIHWIWVLGFMQNEWRYPQIIAVIIIDIIAVLIYIIPQIGIHKMLKSAKSEMFNVINDIYELDKVRSIIRFASFSKSDEILIKKLPIQKGIVDETNNLKTWPIDLQDAINLIAVIVSNVFPLLTKLYFTGIRF